MKCLILGQRLEIKITGLECLTVSRNKGIQERETKIGVYQKDTEANTKTPNDQAWNN